MTNLEKYKDEIINILTIYVDSELGVEDDKPVNCKFISCEECDLSSKYGESCRINTIKWLAAEAKE